MAGQAIVEPVANANEKPPPGGLDDAHDKNGDGGDHGEEDQGLEAAAGQHPVKDLHHVDRRGQDQQVYAEAEHDQPDQRPQTTADDELNGEMGFRAFGHHKYLAVIWNDAGQVTPELAVNVMESERQRKRQRITRRAGGSWCRRHVPVSYGRATRRSSRIGEKNMPASVSCSACGKETYGGQPQCPHCGEADYGGKTARAGKSPPSGSATNISWISRSTGKPTTPAGSCFRLSGCYWSPRGSAGGGSWRGWTRSSGRNNCRVVRRLAG
jgi:hypothetical protein